MKAPGNELYENVRRYRFMLMLAFYRRHAEVLGFDAKNVLTDFAVDTKGEKGRERMRVLLKNRVKEIKVGVVLN